MENSFEPANAIVELFGHNKIAGLVSQQTIGGVAFVRVDVPKTSKSESFTKTFHGNAIYAFNWVTAETAQKAAEDINTTPISIWDIKAAAQELVDNAIQQGKLKKVDELPEPKEVDDEEYYDDDDYPY